MKLVFSVATVAALALAPLSALADGHSGGAITDQSYEGGKASHAGASASSAHVMNTCPREFREMYRGDLYCRQPEYQVIAPRSGLCPEDVHGLYRGNLYCLSGRG